MQTLEQNSSDIETSIIIPKKRVPAPLQWVQTDTPAIESFINFCGSFATEHVTADLSQITNMQDYIESFAKLHINNKVIIDFTKPGVGAVASLTIAYMDGGYEAMVNSLPGAAVSR